MKKVMFLFFLVFSVLFMWAEPDNFYLTTADLGEQRLVKVEDMDGNMTILSEAEIAKPDIMGKSYEGEELKINLSNIETLKIAEGHYGFTAGLVGEFILGTIIGVATIEEETEESEYISSTTIKINYPAMLLGCAAGFGLGYWVGTTMPKWVKMYDASEFGQINDNNPIMFTSWYSNEKLYAGINIRF
jgi:hypothetical protein